MTILIYVECYFYDIGHQLSARSIVKSLFDFTMHQCFGKWTRTSSCCRCVSLIAQLSFTDECHYAFKIPNSKSKNQVHGMSVSVLTVSYTHRIMKASYALEMTRLNDSLPVIIIHIWLFWIGTCLWRLQQWTQEWRYLGFVFFFLDISKRYACNWHLF